MRNVIPGDRKYEHIDMSIELADINDFIEDIYKVDKLGKSAVIKIKSTINHPIVLKDLNKIFFSRLSSNIVKFIEKYKAQNLDSTDIESDTEINSNIQLV
ncbi:repeat-containing B domain protein [Orientia chuto str. Dubai]|uniref:Repeat-containing B domain protein n=1 Tax=Orientia chuto str. Dubai TaxID=1359168 RepID=A0A0F3MRD8_9RICK|nr:hypothetical protein [Candidatus Orientia mediorientalis]KJV57154.1 repeat-containing B domain protein [Orientia chuto str. Dubai]